MKLWLLILIGCGFGMALAALARGLRRWRLRGKGGVHAQLVSRPRLLLIGRHVPRASTANADRVVRHIYRPRHTPRDGTPIVAPAQIATAKGALTT